MCRDTKPKENETDPAGNQTNELGSAPARKAGVWARMRERPLLTYHLFLVTATAGLIAWDSRLEVDSWCSSMLHQMIATIFELDIISKAISVLVAAILFLCLYPHLAVSRMGLDPEPAARLRNDIRDTWAKILGGGFILITLFIGYNQLVTEQEGQITDRFKSAVDQLGSDKMQVRLGGIYALERISRDSDKDYWTVMEVLSAFVRESANRKRPSCDTELAPREKPHRTRLEKQAEAHHTAEGPSEEGFVAKLDTDVQAAMTVIARRKKKYGEGEDLSIDVSGAALAYLRLFGHDGEPPNLGGMDMSGCDLRRAILSRADLTKADLTKADLSGVDLCGADLWESKLRGARLCAADLRKAKLTRADMDGADLRSADLWGAKLDETRLFAADLWGAYLSSADLRKANLSEAHLEKTYLAGAVLAGANLSEAHLEKAYLGGADMRGASLSGASLREADLSGANLRGALLVRTNLREVWLSREQFESAFKDESTIQPHEFLTK